MAFNLDRFTRSTLAFNSGALTLTDASIVNGPTVFTYASASDNAAAIAAAGYFNPESVIYDLKVDDIIMGTASDASFALVVATVNTTATPRTITTVSMGLTGAVDTANIADGAVTNVKVNAAAAIAFSKLEVMTSGNVLVGSAANVATEVTMSGDATIIASGALTIAADAVTSAKLAEDTIQTITVTISTAELLALATTPKQLVAAPGADKVVQFLGAELVLNYAGVAYTESGDNMAVKYENAAGVAVSDTIECTGFIDATADTLTNAVPVKDVIVAATGCVNKALVMDNIGSNFAAGTSPVDVIVAYKVVTAGL